MLKLLRIAALSLAVLGFASNHVVMAANGGKMPVIASECQLVVIQDARHACVNQSVRLAPLADRMDTHHGVLSIGDLLIFSGVLISFATILVRRSEGVQ